jgi:hypothetical protein
VSSWAEDLARAYARCRATHPEDLALVVCDLDTLWEASARVRDRPCRGVVDILRWFQFQPLTDVAVIAGGTEADRPAVQARLDELGREYRMAWRPDLVQLPAGDSTDQPADRLDALRAWRGRGAQVAAVLDSDRACVEALGRAGELDDAALVPTGDVLAERAAAVAASSAGSGGHVELVWHQANDEIRLRQFLASPVRWAEVDARCDPDGRLRAHHDDDPTDGEEPPLSLEALLGRLAAAGKGVNIDVKEPDALVPALAAAQRAGLDDHDIWLNGRIDKLGERGFRSVPAAHPAARMQCPAELLGPLVAAMPCHADSVLDELTTWGIGRFSVAWTHPQRDLLLSHLADRGLEVNLYAVTDLAEFLAAVLRLPHSITADLTLPEWHYYGRGSGNDGSFHRDHQAAATSPGVDIP